MEQNQTMKCPFRKRRKMIHYTTGKDFVDCEFEEEFCDCYKWECPYYRTVDQNPDIGICNKIECERGGCIVRRKR